MKINYKPKNLIPHEGDFIIYDNNFGEQFVSMIIKDDDRYSSITMDDSAQGKISKDGGYSLGWVSSAEEVLTAFKKEWEHVELSPAGDWSITNEN
ncbi:hypothetical protein [uncultured Lactobacillus sp.]|uniref:hypothetical protein n=1 Tax=uncultured Lactobacillus sp. TaxID=153152 RepID=UPI0026318530|nr:hypothetical protein [uncultured Lactobacillus sp.]